MSGGQRRSIRVRGAEPDSELRLRVRNEWLGGARQSRGFRLGGWAGLQQRAFPAPARHGPGRYRRQPHPHGAEVGLEPRTDSDPSRQGPLAGGATGNPFASEGQLARSEGQYFDRAEPRHTRRREQPRQVQRRSCHHRRETLAGSAFGESGGDRRRAGSRSGRTRHAPAEIPGRSLDQSESGDDGQQRRGLVQRHDPRATRRGCRRVPHSGFRPFFTRRSGAVSGGPTRAGMSCALGRSAAGGQFRDLPFLDDAGDAEPVVEPGTPEQQTARLHLCLRQLSGDLQYRRPVLQQSLPRAGFQFTRRQRLRLCPEFSRRRPVAG